MSVSHACLQGSAETADWKDVIRAVREQCRQLFRNETKHEPRNADRADFLSALMVRCVNDRLAPLHIHHGMLSILNLISVRCVRCVAVIGFAGR